MIEDSIFPGDLVRNPFSGSFGLFDSPESERVSFFHQRTVEVFQGQVGLVIAVTGSYMYVLTGDRLGWCAFGMFDKVL